MILRSKITNCEVLSSKSREIESSFWAGVGKTFDSKNGRYRHWAFRFTLTDDFGYNYYLYSDFTVNKGVSVHFTD